MLRDVERHHSSVPPPWKHWSLLLILIVYLVLGFTYSVVDPIFEASDEIFHYPVVMQIADGRGLPIQDSRDKTSLWQQEGSQPPLYYLIAAGITSWIDTGTMDTIMLKNPHAQIGRPGAKNNRNMVIHTSEEDFPYQGVSLAVHLIRALSILMGAGTVILTYLIALSVVPGNRVLAGLTAALAAFNPMFLFISASVNNDNLTILLCTLALYLILRGMRSRPSWPWALGLGVVTALAALTKLSGLSLLPLVAFAFASVTAQQNSWRSFVSWILMAASAFVILDGWWLLRNLQLYGDPTGLNAMLDQAGRRSANPGPFVLWAEGQGFRRSYWGVFGGFDVGADSRFYQFFDILTILGLLGLGVLLIRQIWSTVRQRVGRPVPFANAFMTPPRVASRQSFLTRTTNWLLFLLRAEGDRAILLRHLIVCTGWVAFLLVSLTRWTQLTLATQGRLMFPAISVISLGMMAGLLVLLPRRLHAAFASALAMLLLAIAAFVPFLYLQPAYARPDTNQALDESSLPERVHVVYNGQMELVGFDAEPRHMRPGDTLQVKAWWRVLRPMDANYSVYVQLRQKGEIVIAQDDAYPGNGAFATSQLKPGDIIAETHWLTVTPAASGPASAQLSIGLYDLRTLDSLPAVDSSGRPSDGKMSITFQVMGTQTAKRPAVEMYTRFADRVELIGLNSELSSAGSQLSLELQWRALADLEKDYTVFVQALNESGNVVAQYDSWPRQGEYPTHLWRKGEQVPDQAILTLPPDNSDELMLIVGLYDLRTMDRLLAGSEDHAIIGRLDRATGRILRP
ncbi:MAG: DUF2142 domain-containing protein [Chloroflexota bacterium]|nr:MAG: DUF2142 domain-containing protein [Chloroflexota bacterium]